MGIAAWGPALGLEKSVRGAGVILIACSNCKRTLYTYVLAPDTDPVLKGGTASKFGGAPNTRRVVAKFGGVCPSCGKPLSEKPTAVEMGSVGQLVNGRLVEEDLFKIVTIKMPDRLHDQLARVAESQGLSMSDIIRLAVARYLEEVKQKVGGQGSITNNIGYDSGLEAPKHKVRQARIEA